MADRDAHELVVYAVGVLVTFDRVGQRFDPTAPVDVAVGCVITLAAAALWPLAVSLILVHKISTIRTAASVASRHDSNPVGRYLERLEQLD
ncbi:MAG: hypothetical protein JWR46_1948 [Mycobacterium sp.]|nr:hypothetical protein [Mycobacterium sp.]